MEAMILSDEPVAVAPISDQRTVADLRRNGYTKLSPELVKDILYLEQLGSSTSRVIDDWKAIEMLEQLPRGDKRAINKLFFSQMESPKAVLGEIDKETFERIQRSLFEVAERRRQNDIDRENDNYLNRMHGLTDLNRRLLQTLKAASESYDRCQALRGMTPASCMAAFESVLKNPFFKFERFAYNKAYFITTNPILMNQKNLALGINRTIDFGKIRFVLDIANNYLSALKAENNLVLPSEHFHPFISNDGHNICFGAQGDDANRFLVNREYGQLFDLLASLLTTYSNNSNPYISFGTFADSELSGKARRVTPKLCDSCRNPEEACVCVKCGLCALPGHESSDCETHCNGCGSAVDDGCRCNDTFCTECDHYGSDCSCDESECPDCENGD